MTMTQGSGNLLDSGCEALVNTVNCVGAMGRGLALAIARAYPACLPEYRTACRTRTLRPGGVLVWEITHATQAKWIFQTATKDHWRMPSRIDDVERAVENLAATITATGARTVAMPALGCGLGGLDRNIVGPMMHRAFAPLAAEIRVFGIDVAQAAGQAAPARRAER